MFQDYALFPHMTVGENVAYGMKVRKVGKAERGKRGVEALEMVQADRLSRSAARASSPAASASEWRWRARSSTARACCSWTSRWGRSTLSCASRCRSS